MLAPTAFGSMYSWSLTNISGLDESLGFPFNQYCVFFVQSLWAIFIALLCSRLPISMNYKKKEESEGEEDKEENGSPSASSKEDEELDDKKWKKVNVTISVVKAET
jgi:hypothetical protein